MIHEKHVYDEDVTICALWQFDLEMHPTKLSSTSAGVKKNCKH